MENYSTKGKKIEHEFAIFFDGFRNNKSVDQETILIDDKDVCHRITNVLRLSVGSRLILFDDCQNVCASIVKIDKSGLVLHKVDQLRQNKCLKPNIVLLLPLLKRESFESAIYSAVELGANQIKFVITKKVQRKWGGQKELDRLNRIAIAAAEQSKNFCIPKLKAPISIEDLLSDKFIQQDKSYRIYCDVDGQSFSETIDGITKQKSENIVVAIGPEGDLACDEKELLKNNSFIFTKLTPTVLRACQAVSCSLGMLRSMLY